MSEILRQETMTDAERVEQMGQLVLWAQGVDIEQMAFPEMSEAGEEQ